ncbi:MAG: carbamoyltransferase HypF [Mangrovicoccus sp.]|nr:carbamoyltransferase HypF [Mangrovicoccus sp.]
MSQGLRIRIRGQVQGVGYRPFVWQLAQRHQIRGEVRNDPKGVLILAYGPALEAFLKALRSDAPPLARIDAVESQPHGFAALPEGFEITASQGSGAQTRVTPDAASCPECLADIQGEDPRRQGYAFTNCTHCGPRFTILKALPYDRARTTMAAFEMCPDCAAEYANPADRRFHAQPIACARCGPRLALDDDPSDPIAKAAQRIAAGDILAIKGLGGFHLCCDASNPKAIATLRARKNRLAKPLALMGRWEDITTYADPSPAEAAALRSPAAPIVLLQQTAPLPESLAPKQRKLGWMLPYTPLHHLLLHQIRRPLVMTSGNLSGAPQVIANDEARRDLASIADGFLDHDREIARRLDDSVLQITDHGPMVLRRARGLVPDTMPLPPGFETAPQVLAYGAHLKSAICLIKHGQALLSHHLGDLDEALTWDAFIKADQDYQALFEHSPTVFACDLHRGYRSSQYAQQRAQGRAHEIQHHHAHLAACLGENRWPRDGGAVAGIICDGLGLGADGTIWGGELLLGDYDSFARSSWLRPAPLLGGDGANREPWRNALAQLDQAGLRALADKLFTDAPRDLLRQAARKGINAPLSSSAGRLFDAVAALIGAHDGPQSYEGEAAMALESLAMQAPAALRHRPYPMPEASAPGEIDPTPLLQALAQDLAEHRPPSEMAMRFHAWLAGVFAKPARALLENGQARAVALSGGCFQSALLLDLTLKALGDVPVMIHRHVPANDGGLALGQALIAAARVQPRR